jgi:small subunit ribosomal protein S21e
MPEISGYVPRKCSHTGKLIKVSDRASIQLSFKKEDCKNNNNIKSFVICGNVRRQGESDSAINQLAEKEGML